MVKKIYRRNGNMIRAKIRDAINAGKDENIPISEYLNTVGIRWTPKKVGMWIYHSMGGEVEVVRNRKSGRNKYRIV